ncbi:MAG: hypothetical protein RMJ00_07145 [Nitrososphaerota archaeon]|nr:hypothetical protein [Candidatus Bathyarchaeota archaeon]MCX8162029.1 hypothetical protein [Candidatus Bathyarchaeota archaeon]MDW8062456.1 hypothetical protein [Nitrososphaerota archaeon]
MAAHRALCRLFVEEPRVAILAKPDGFYQRYIDAGLKIGYKELKALFSRKALSHCWGWFVRYVELYHIG